MYGVGVAFGISEFGSGGFALEFDASMATMGGTAAFAAAALVTSLTDAAELRITANSSLLLDPAGVAVNPKQPSRSRSPLVTAKPTSVQTLRSIPQPIAHNYAIVPEKKV